MAMVSSRLVFLFSICILISQAFALQRYFLYYNCSDNGNYTSNSTYKANLNRVLYSLSSNTEINYGFYNFSYGKSPDQVYSIGLCRGDVNPDICLSCLKNATNLLTLLCPTQKEAIGGFDYCLLRYSFSDIFSKMVGSPAFVMRNVDNVSSNYDQFRQDLTTLLGRKISEAAAGGSRKKFAVGKTAAPDSQTLYSLAQCTPDLSVQDCRDCLNATATELLPNCCDGRQGGRVVRPSCSLRYEIYLFYNATADNASSPSLSPPPPPVPSVTPPVPSVSPPASNNTPAAEGTNAIKLKM